MCFGRLEEFVFHVFRYLRLIDGESVAITRELVIIEILVVNGVFVHGVFLKSSLACD